MSDKITTILFTANAKFETSPATIYYGAGEVHELRDDLANRWIRRGVATADPELIAQARAPGPVEETGPSGHDIPDDWRALNAADTVALAVTLGADPEAVRFKAQAAAFIEGKIAERAAALT
ncbi:MAG: hypothetical protein FD144_2666 [Rhodospirillaceae bacterium]|nr:MAG: hypothetical protein FD144_2666 [Rhodospirillaceae bacterium]